MGVRQSATIVFPENAKKSRNRMNEKYKKTKRKRQRTLQSKGPNETDEDEDDTDEDDGNYKKYMNQGSGQYGDYQKYKQTKWWQRFGIYITYTQ